MDIQYWPRLQKVEAVLPYIGMDLKRWTCEGDESDDIISARTDICLLRTDNGQHSMQVIVLQIGAKVSCLLIDKRQRS